MTPRAAKTFRGRSAPDRSASILGSSADTSVCHPNVILLSTKSADPCWRVVPFVAVGLVACVEMWYIGRLRGGVNIGVTANIGKRSSK